MLTPQPVLLADEPFDGLDLRQSREAATALRAHAADGPHARAVDSPDRRRRAGLRSVRAALERTRLRRRRDERAGRTGRLARTRLGRARSRGDLPCAHVARSRGSSRRSGASWSPRARGGCILALVGPLVGVSFISAVRTYAEVSAGSAGAGGASRSAIRSIGIWAPTFSAYELAAMFLLPFVAIRVVSGDRQSGALKLELQQRDVALSARIARQGPRAPRRLARDAAARPIAAIVLWQALRRRHVSRRSSSCRARARAQRRASRSRSRWPRPRRSEHPSTAAIVTLASRSARGCIAFSRRRARRRVGTARGVHAGGDGRAVPARRCCSLEPCSSSRSCWSSRASRSLRSGFSSGVAMRRRVVRIRRHRRQRAGASSPPAPLVHATGTRRRTGSNSFPEADEEALRRDSRPAHHRSAPRARRIARRFDLEHQALSKLRRVMPGVRSSTRRARRRRSTSKPIAGYGEIWYDLGGRARDEPDHHRRGRARNDFRSRGRHASRAKRAAVRRPSARGSPGRRVIRVLRRLAGGRRRPRGFADSGGMYDHHSKDAGLALALAAALALPLAACGRRTSKWISARKPSAKRRVVFEPMWARGSSRKMDPTR